MKIDMRHLGLLAGTALLAACGGSGDEPAPAEPADTTEAEAPAEDTADAGDAAPAPDNTETVDGTTLANFTGDASAGEQVFAQCGACHVVEPGVNRIGPSLHGIVGNEAGQVEGFNYSPANANSGIEWTPEKMFQYLENPQRVIPGTTMTFAGLSDPQDRADVIAYLESTE
ncbi:c-type cytochrome [Aurantiacibacter sediminis]|nr:cytochrome c family protein [Aurantiacibacter sediminis]